MLDHDAETGLPRIGPNAVLQLLGPLSAAVGPTEARAILAASGYWPLPRAENGLIPQAPVAALFAAVRGRLGPGADAVLAAAGRATADYVMANRIPRPVRALLRVLPGPIAARLLTRAIAGNAWTFAGSGAFAVQDGGATLEIGCNPLAVAPRCAWHEAVFTKLYQTLAGRSYTVTETACCGAGAPACRFRLDRG